MSESDGRLRKRATGIEGLDQLTGGGLPRDQATLVVGGPGTGKTVLALQILAYAVERGDGGVFVSFEESPAQVRRNAASFRWGASLHGSQIWTVIDARLRADAETAGAFDIDALLAAVQATAGTYRDPWIVIDGIDQLLQRQPDHIRAVDQVRQINEHCEQHGWSILLSGKLDAYSSGPQHLEGIEFMLPTTLVLSATMIERRLNRYLRVAKYRGSAHGVDEVPLIMDGDGIQLPYQMPAAEGPSEASNERISSGVERLDRVLGGGPFRGSSTLISGRPGTSKSTLAASFGEAAAARGERALYVSFDELQAQYVRNLASVGIDLQHHIEAGRIRFCSLYAWSALVVEHVLTLQRLIEEFKPDLLIVDPVSAMLKAGGNEGPRAATERLLGLARRRGITTVLTSLISEGDPEGESTAAHVSTVADTWIVLDYNVRAGERNRSISIVKSRGSAHSNQQRELVLSSNGLDLADAYEYGSEVLMGTARAQKESEDRAAARRRTLERERRRQDLARQIEHARSELDRLQADLAIEEQGIDESEQLEREYTKDMQRRRDPDGLAAAGRSAERKAGNESRNR